MEFAIQVNNPKYFSCKDENSSTINEILQDIFPLCTESCILYWNHVCVPIGYKYDISVIFDDIVCMVEEILNNETGDLCIHWPSSTFRTDWMLLWDASTIAIESTWEGVMGGRLVENMLNSVGKLKIGKLEFLREWKMLIIKIVEILSECGTSVPGIKETSELIERIDGKGILYTQDKPWL
jgi:hypothetical protein